MIYALAYPLPIEEHINRFIGKELNMYEEH